MKYNEALGGLNNLMHKIKTKEYVKEALEESKTNTKTKTNKSQGTTNQTTLAIYYMQKAKAFPRKTGNNTTDAEFIQFLTGGSIDNIRKKLGDHLSRKKEKTGKSTQNLISDLNKVRSQFEKIEFNDGIELIKKDIEILEKDLESFTE